MAATVGPHRWSSCWTSSIIILPASSMILGSPVGALSTLLASAGGMKRLYRREQIFWACPATSLCPAATFFSRTIRSVVRRWCAYSASCECWPAALDLGASAVSRRANSLISRTSNSCWTAPSVVKHAKASLYASIAA